MTAVYVDEERDKAVQAVALGAYDFYQKPVDADTLPLIVDRAFRLVELEEENRQLKAQARPALAGVVTASPAMLRIDDSSMFSTFAPSP